MRLLFFVFLWVCSSPSFAQMSKAEIIAEANSPCPTFTWKSDEATNPLIMPNLGQLNVSPTLSKDFKSFQPITVPDLSQRALSNFDQAPPLMAQELPSTIGGAPTEISQIWGLPTKIDGKTLDPIPNKLQWVETPASPQFLGKGYQSQLSEILKNWQAKPTNLQPCDQLLLQKTTQLNTNEIASVQKEMMNRFNTPPIVDDDTLGKPKPKPCDRCVTNPTINVVNFPLNAISNTPTLYKGHSSEGGVPLTLVDCQWYDMNCINKSKQLAMLDMSKLWRKVDAKEGIVFDCNADPTKPGSYLKTKFPTAANGETRECTQANVATDPLCIATDNSKFQSVVELELSEPMRPTTCSGVAIAPQLVLTAAHCFLDQKTFKDSPESWRDTILNDKNLNLLKLQSSTGIKLQDFAGTIPVDKIAIHPSFEIVSKGYFDAIPINDLALVHTITPLIVEPVLIAENNSWSSDVTYAGYGIASQTDFKSSLQLGWMWKLASSDSLEHFSKGIYGSRFCEGDSGGPVFAGHLIGCPPNTKWADKSPRILQGIISSYVPASKGGSDYEKCDNATQFRIEKIDRTQIAKWACEVFPETTFCIKENSK
jgi:V8-like Glu-specific endopeptidase